MTTTNFNYRNGDGAKWGPGDWYDDFRAELVRALKTGKDFDTGWYGVKKEIQSARIRRDGSKLWVEVSVSNDFDITGQSEGWMDLSPHDLSSDASTERCLDAFTEEIDKTLLAAEDDQKDNDFIGMFVVGKDQGPGMSPWQLTFLVDFSGHGFDVPPGDSYHRWGWQEVETDDDLDMEAIPRELDKETADQIRNAIFEGGIPNEGEVFNGWRVRPAT